MQFFEGSDVLRLQGQRCGMVAGSAARAAGADSEHAAAETVEHMSAGLSVPLLVAEWRGGARPS